MARQVTDLPVRPGRDSGRGGVGKHAATPDSAVRMRPGRVVMGRAFFGHDWLGVVSAGLDDALDDAAGPKGENDGFRSLHHELLDDWGRGEGMGNHMFRLLSLGRLSTLD